MAASSPTEEHSEYHDLFSGDLNQSPVATTSQTPYRFPSIDPSQNNTPLLFAKSPVTRLRATNGGNTSLSALNFVASPLSAPILNTVISSPTRYKPPSHDFEGHFTNEFDPTWQRSVDEGLPSQGLLSFDQPFGDAFAQTDLSTPRARIPQTPARGTQIRSAPSTVSRKHQRSVSGLGTPSVMRSGGRKRQQTVELGSPVAGRRIDSGQSFTTTAPLSRNVSMSSIYNRPTQERNISGVSSMTASTSFEVRSPNLRPYMPISQSLPGLVPSSQASPQLSQGHSPLQTPTQTGYVFESPDPTAGIFAAQQQSLMQGMEHVMHPQSAPNSASIMSVSSFTGHPARHGTLSTIVETPQIQEVYMVPSNQFQTVEYPPVPGLQTFDNLPVDTQHPDVNSWVHQTHESRPVAPIDAQYGYPMQEVPYYPVSMPQAHQPVFARHTSATYPLGYGMPQTLSAPPLGNRSVSAPGYPSSSLSSMSMSEMDMQGGLFGPIRPMDPEAGPSRYYEEPSTTTTSPVTPSKRKAYPRVGNPMKPGPKPKPKTPKKMRTSSQTGSSPDRSGIDPSMIGGSLPRIEEDQPEHKPVLSFGGDLVTAAMQRTASHSIQYQPPSQPQLVIQPPRTTVSEQPASGLPKTFLEKLYTTQMCLEGGAPQKRFKCMIEGCERSFPRKSAIHSHIQTHLEDKPFQCDEPDW